MQPTHLDADGRLRMVDVSAKDVTHRSATARALVRMSAATEAIVRAAALPKGDALVAAQIAGIFAAKHTSMLIPLAHPLPLSSVDVDFSWPREGVLAIDATARTSAQTGVEMEAMTAAAIAALTIYDMLKSVERGVRIEDVHLVAKHGGKSGSWSAPS